MQADPLAARIVDEALAMAAERGWQAVRLRLIAERLGVSLPQVAERFRDVDAVADEVFRRAWAAMLAPPPVGFAELPSGERLSLVLLRWFDALAPHRRVVAQMLAAKLYPAHPHHWVPAIFNLSRTIHWLRDAALLDAGGFRRQAEEISLSALFLAALAVWLADDSEGQRRTRDFVRRRLAGWR